MKHGPNGHWKLAVALAMAAAPGLSSPALAADINGFLRDKGHGDAAISYTTESYDEFRITFVANLPYVKAEGDTSAGFEQEGVQDLTLLGKCRLASFGSKAKSSFVGGLGLRTIASNY